MYSNTVNVGDHLRNGAYRIDGILGQGGFGITYLSSFMALKKKVAIKEFFLSGYCVRSTEGNFIHPQSIPPETFELYKNKFIEEAQTLAQFNHPNIVRVTDVFEENNTAYFVMEYIQGKSLAQLIDERGRLPEYQALRYITQVAMALKVVHSRNILHRDIKPENIIIAENDEAVLIDFGTARTFADGKTITHTTMLTPGYAPMEQYSDRQRRGFYTDIYALGATFYACLSGQPPLPAIDRLANPAIGQIPGVSGPVLQTIKKSMDIDPSNRFQDIDSFLDSIQGGDNTIPQGFAYGSSSSGRPTELKPPQGNQSWEESHKAAPAETVRPRAKPASGNNFLTIAIAVAAVVAIAFALFLWSNFNSNDQLTQYNRAMSDGEGYFREQNYELAIQSFQDALRYNDGDPRAQQRIQDSRNLLSERQSEQAEQERKKRMEAKARQTVATFFEAMDNREESRYLSTLADQVRKYGTWENMSKYEILDEARTYWEKNVTADDNTVDWSTFNVYEQADGAVKTTFRSTYYFLSATGKTENTLILDNVILLNKDYKINYYSSEKIGSQN